MWAQPSNIPIETRQSWLSVSRQNFELGLLWFTMALSGLLFIEPAPFDLMIVVLVGVWLFSGLHIPRTLTLPIVLVGLLTVTGLVGAWLSTTIVGSTRHVIISIFLYVLAVGLAAYISRDPKKILPTVMSGFTVAAMIASIAAIIGYFGIVDGTQDLFLLYGRGRGTLKDPNVFGPFIVVPMVYIYVRHLLGEERIGGLQTLILGVLGFGLLLSFSRGAWVNLIFASGTATYLLFISAKSNSLRLKVIGLTLCVTLLSIVMVAIALSFDAIAELMNVRGKLIQSYDTDERFAGAYVAIDIILSNPLGIGARSFRDFHPSEPHNVYLYNFLIGGWLGGFSYIGLVLSTVYVGFRSVMTASALRVPAIIFFSTFLANVLEGFIIDSDHWRHFYVLMACLWGIFAYNMRMRRTAATAPEQRSFRPSLKQFLTNRIRRKMVRTGTTNTKISKTDTTFQPNRSVRQTWRRKLGARKASTSTRTLQESVKTETVHPRPETVVPRSQLPSNDKSAPIVSTEQPTQTASPKANVTPPPLDREVFGVRDDAGTPERAVFGQRTRATV